MYVRDLMTEGVITIHEDTPIPEAKKFLTSHNISGAIVIGNNEQQVGVISNTDFYNLLKSFQNKEQYLKGYNVKSILKSNKIFSVKKDETLTKAVNIMIEKKVHRLFVENDEGKIIGVLSYSDIVNRLHNKEVKADLQSTSVTE